MEEGGCVETHGQHAVRDLGVVLLAGQLGPHCCGVDVACLQHQLLVRVVCNTGTDTYLVTVIYTRTATDKHMRTYAYTHRHTRGRTHTY